MVKSGRGPLEERPFRNPSRPQLGIEVLTLAELRRRLTPDAFAAPHRLDFHQITFITRGRGVAVIDFDEHRCSPGRLLHTRPGQVQRLPRTDAGSAQPDGVIVLFTRSFVQRPGLVAGLGTDVWQLEQQPGRRVRSLLTEIATEYRQAADHEDSPLLLRHLLTALLIHIARLPRDTRSSAEPGTSDYFRFVQELEHRFTRTRRVRDYAAALGCSPRTLTRTSLAATGRTAKQVIDDRVSLEAKRLLAHTDRQIAAIGNELGFSEATNFVKFFVAREGITPAAFRSRQRRA
jgi:AraC-like DNA-binding protein